MTTFNERELKEQLFEQNAIDSIIAILKMGSGITAGEILGNLFVEYLKNNKEQFFEWNLHKKDFLRNITFKSRQRSIFKNYQENLSSLYWSSLQGVCINEMVFIYSYKKGGGNAIWSLKDENIGGKGERRCVVFLAIRE